MHNLDPLTQLLFITIQPDLRVSTIQLGMSTKANQECFQTLLLLWTWTRKGIAICNTHNIPIMDITSSNLNMCDRKVLKDYNPEECTHQDCKWDSQETTHKEKAILKN